jgi:hypothetical protein
LYGDGGVVKGRTASFIIIRIAELIACHIQLAGFAKVGIDAYVGIYKKIGLIY